MTLPTHPDLCFYSQYQVGLEREYRKLKNHIFALVIFYLFLHFRTPQITNTHKHSHGFFVSSTHLSPFDPFPTLYRCLSACTSLSKYI